MASLDTQARKSWGIRGWDYQTIGGSLLRPTHDDFLGAGFVGLNTENQLTSNHYREFPEFLFEKMESRFRKPQRQF